MTKTLTPLHESRLDEVRRRAHQSEAEHAKLLSSYGPVDLERVYFLEGLDCIKIGYSGGEHQRTQDYKCHGYVLLAVLPAKYDDEQSLHKHFRKYRMSSRGKEYYEKHDDIYAYVDWLLRRKYARAREDMLAELDYLDFNKVWHPRHVSGIDIAENGQLTFLDSCNVKERVQFVSTETGELNSIGDEWSTPKEWIDKARDVMGSIDCDPATCGPYNRRWVHAPIFYTKERSGLLGSSVWKGNIWLNPPYGRGNESAGNFIERLASERDCGNVVQAITCLNLNSMSSEWFSPLYRIASAHAICHSRIDFVPKPGEKSTSPTKGTVFSYVGDNVDRFAELFSAPTMQTTPGREMRKKMLQCAVLVPHERPHG